MLICTVGFAVLAAAQLASGQACSVDETQKLFASDATTRYRFGGAVALDDTHAVVGSSEAGDSSVSRSGVVYVQRRDDNGTPLDPTDDFWVEQAKLTASDRVQRGGFGWNVAISGDYIVVNSLNDSRDLVSSGAAYVFRRDDNDTPADPDDDVWLEEAKLVASDAAASDFFGWRSAAINGRWAIIGAIGAGNSGGTQQDGEGAAYVFVRNDNGTPEFRDDDFWSDSAKLTAPDGRTNDRFGVSAAINDDWAVVGASRVGRFGEGYVYIYRINRNDTPSNPNDDSWTEHIKLTLPSNNTTISTGFGTSVAIHLDGMVVGAPNDSSGRGAVYVYRRNDSGSPLDLSDDEWIETGKLTTPPFQDDIFSFGRSVSIHGNLVVVAADLFGSSLCDPYSCGTGKVFFFQREEFDWPLVAEALSGHDPNTVSDSYASSVSAGCNLTLVGAGFDHDMGFQAGAAYSYSVDCGACVEDCNSNGISDVYESDLDGDSIIDECDGCPSDPEKSDPSVCGCNVPETIDDSDLDGVPDCLDACPTDQQKTEPGICGCGVDDILDSDGDGAPDCLDGCPADSQKTTPDICGCGVNDSLDSDGDTVPNCVDQCSDLDDRRFAPSCIVPVPAVSTWGAVTLAACLLVAVVCVASRRGRT